MPDREAPSSLPGHTSSGTARITIVKILAMAGIPPAAIQLFLQTYAEMTVRQLQRNFFYIEAGHVTAEDFRSLTI